MKLQRLRGRKQNDYVRKNGNVFKGKTMVCRWLPGKPRTSRAGESGLFVGTAGSSKLHKSAVKRNRMRRRCREALRKAVVNQQTLPDRQILLSPRILSLTCDNSLIEEDVRNFLSEIRK